MGPKVRIVLNSHCVEMKPVGLVRGARSSCLCLWSSRLMRLFYGAT